MTMVRRQGMLLSLVGPAGAGKTVLVQELHAKYPDSTNFSVSATSRAPRKTDRDGIDYHFVSRKRFEEMIQAGELFEWEETHGNYYGTLKSTVERAINGGNDLLLDIDIRGALNFKDRFPSHAVIIFVLPPSRNVLEERLRARGTDTAADLAVRLQTADREFSQLLGELKGAQRIDYLIVNNERQAAIQLITSILDAERAKLMRLSAEDVAEICAVK